MPVTLELALVKARRRSPGRSPLFWMLFLGGCAIYEPDLLSDQAGASLGGSSSGVAGDGTAALSSGAAGSGNNQPLTQDFCLAMEARNGIWFAMDCADPRPYVCELY